MKCLEFKKWVGDHVDGELIGSLRGDLDYHMAECPSCRQSYEAMAKAWDILGELPEIEPSPAFVSRFWTKVAAQGNRKDRFANIFHYPKWMPVAITLSMIVIVGSLNVFSINSKQGEMSRLSGSDFEIIENIELAEHLDVINDIDWLQDMDVIQDLDFMQS